MKKKPAKYVSLQVIEKKDYCSRIVIIDKFR